MGTVNVVDLPEPLRRFITDPDDVPIEEALFGVAQCRTGPTIDLEDFRAQLDALAAGVSEPNAAAICSALFGTAGFRGDTADYYDPRNSMLDLVVARRIGMPITLSVVMIAVARRLGVALQAIGAPGHFLVFDTSLMQYRDPFNGGAIVDQAAFQQAMAGVGRPDLLRPAGPFEVVSRVLNNLQNSYASRDARQLDWVLDLRMAMPDALHGDQRLLAALCERRGRFGEAATILVRLGDRLNDDRLRRRAEGLAARLN